MFFFNLSSEIEPIEVSVAVKLPSLDIANFSVGADPGPIVVSFVKILNPQPAEVPLYAPACSKNIFALAVAIVLEPSVFALAPT